MVRARELGVVGTGVGVIDSDDLLGFSASSSPGCIALLALPLISDMMLTGSEPAVVVHI